MNLPHFTPRSVIELTLAKAPDSNATTLPDPCAGTAEFSLMAITAAQASSKEPRNA